MKRNLFLKHHKAFYAINDDIEVNGKVRTSWFITMNMYISLQEPNLKKNYFIFQIY
jgi:hypothetical protein